MIGLMPDTDPNDLAAIAGIRLALEAAENAGDADAAAMHVTDDAVLMVPDFPVQVGKPACLAFLRDVMGWLSAEFHRQIAYVSDEVTIIGDRAIDRGSFAFTVEPKSGGASSRTTGKYLWLLRRESGGEWKVEKLIISRDENADSSEVHPVKGQPRWYARPVFYVADLGRALQFYVDTLGFVKHWHEGAGSGTVCQVNMSDCEIILCQHATRRDKARLFIELNVAGLAELRQQVRERSIPTRDVWWGYDSLQIDDPDGNELIFPVEGSSP